MSGQEHLIREAAEEARDPRARRRRVLVLVLTLIAAITTAIAGWLAYSNQRDQAESGTNLAAEVAAACATQPADPNLVDLCQKANRVIREEPVPEPDQAAEVQEREIQNKEVQNPERQNPERQNPEHQNPERQQPENQQDEVQQDEIDNPDPDDPEIDNPDSVDDPDPDDPDPNDPDPVDDPDPNSQLDFRIDDQCEPPPGDVVTDVDLEWVREPGIITLRVTCSSVTPPPQGTP